MPSTTTSPRPARTSSRRCRARSRATTRRASTRATRTAARRTSGTSQGTSFAAPQVTAAAALLLAQRSEPDGGPGRRRLLERTAVDLNASTGCPSARCCATRSPAGAGSTSRRRSTALRTGPLPPADRFETNDDVGGHAARLGGTRREARGDARLLGRPDGRLRGRPRARRRLTVSLSRRAPARSAAPPLEPADAHRLRRARAEARAWRGRRASGARSGSRTSRRARRAAGTTSR